MKIKGTGAFILLVGALLPTATAVGEEAIDVGRYAWEAPAVSRIRGAGERVTELREAVQRVLDAGPLAPLRTYYADAPGGTYLLYREPGRIVTTLAWAYPHLTRRQQEQVREAVRRELADPRRAPWAPRLLAANAGKPREPYPVARTWGDAEVFDADRPRVQGLYGVWLYAHRSGDWDGVRRHWTAALRFYRERRAEAGLYGTMGAHVAMVRLAERFGDAAIREAAVESLKTHLEAGRDFARVEAAARTAFPEMAAKRKDGWVYRGWMFLDLAPEIGRYLAEHVREPVLTRHAFGKARFPLWWLQAAPYQNRWTGDEAVGLPPEMLGMIVPVERWVVGADASALAAATRSAPTGLGDCHWLEALVHAIESHGQLRWRDVREGR